MTNPTINPFVASYMAAGAIAKFTAVTRDANGRVAAAAASGAGSGIIGVTLSATTAIDQPVSVSLVGPVLPGRSGGAIAAGSFVNRAASGKFTQAAGASTAIAGTATAATDESFDLHPCIIP